MARPGPDFSILALGRRLGAMREREHLLEVLGNQRGHEQPHAPLDAHRLAQRHAKRAQEATAAHADALGDLILASQPDGLADALLLVMVAGSRLETLTNATDPKDAHREQARVEAALLGVVRVMAREAGVTLAELGGRFYASTWCDPWPDVDLSGVVADPACHVNACIDGSGPQPAAGRAAA